MKTLLYKEFKLAVHPLCYIFVILFPFMIFIPNYPLFVAFIYVVFCYFILFLGSNKGQQSNDLLYTTLLPVRKKRYCFSTYLNSMHFTTIYNGTYCNIVSNGYSSSRKYGKSRP